MSKIRQNLSKNSRVYPKLKVKSPKTSNFRQIHYPPKPEKRPKKAWANHSIRIFVQKKLLPLEILVGLLLWLHSILLLNDRQWQSGCKTMGLKCTPKKHHGLLFNQIGGFKFLKVYSSHQIYQSITSWPKMHSVNEGSSVTESRSEIWNISFQVLCNELFYFDLNERHKSESVATPICHLHCLDCP